ncbi:MAG: 6-carboxytetrahydropterin synthase [Bdellovibrionota bacterium]
MAYFELRVEVEFSAAHHLEGYPGDCARPHGHNWVLEIFARSQGLDSIGLAVDFKALKSKARELVAPWDHQDLNVLPDFKPATTRNPSAEEIAKLAFERLSDSINTAQTRIDRVTVWENPRCSATYVGDSKA